MDIYEMTTEGTPTWVLGLAIDYDLARGTLRISQENYVKQLLIKYNMTQCNICKTPAATLRLTATVLPMPQEEAAEMRNKPYRNLVGALLFLMTSH